jgi:DNA-binding NtrC family response regulator
LSYHFLKKYAARNRKEIRSISHDALKLLLSQDFPGNVRELENVIERGVIFCKTDTLEKEDLFLEDPRADLFPEVDKGVSGLDFREAKEMVIQRFHEQYIQRLLRESDGNISKAAEMAGIQRQYLHRLMKEAGIDAERFKSRS